MNVVDHRPPGARAGISPATTGMFRIERPGPPLLIERLAFDMTDLGDQLAVQVNGDT